MEPETRLQLVSILVVLCGLLGLSRLLGVDVLGKASATPSAGYSDYHELVDSARAELEATGRSQILETLLVARSETPNPLDSPMGTLLRYALLGAFALLAFSGLISLLGFSQIHLPLYFAAIGLVFIPLVGYRAGINFLEVSQSNFRWELLAGCFLCALMLWVSRSDRKVWRDNHQVRQRAIQS